MLGRNVCLLPLGAQTPTDGLFGSTYEKPRGFCKEGALLNLYTEQILPVKNDVSIPLQKALVPCMRLYHDCFSRPLLQSFTIMIQGHVWLARFGPFQPRLPPKPSSKEKRRNQK